MEKIETWKALQFIATLLIIAMIINGAQDYRRENPAPAVFQIERPQTVVRSEPASRTPSASHPSEPSVYAPPRVVQKTPEELAAERAAYLARYLNNDFTRKPGMKIVAVAVATEDGKPNRVVTAALAKHLKADNVELLSSFFKPAFLADNLIADFFTESTGVFDRLSLNNSLDALLLARQTVEYLTNPSLENVITANMRLEVMTSSASPNGERQTWFFSANGAGFTQSDARALAEERLLKQISADTKMSLQRVLPAK